MNLGMQKTGTIIGGVIAFIAFAATLGTMASNLVTARGTSGVPTTFQTGVDLTFLVLGFAGIAVLAAVIYGAYKSGGKGD